MGTRVIVAFLHLIKQFLNFLKPQPTQPTIDSYGQPSLSIEPEQLQSVMENGCLLVCSMRGRHGKSHIIWYDGANLNPSLERVMKKAMRSCEPIFLYRCGGKMQPPPNGHYWRMMGEHPSMRIYQLEVRDDK